MDHGNIFCFSVMEDLVSLYGLKRQRQKREAHIMLSLALFLYVFPRFPLVTSIDVKTIFCLPLSISQGMQLDPSNLSLIQ